MSRAHPRRVLENFDAAAESYDEVASAQKMIALRLVEKALPYLESNASILDVGCGTGFVAHSISLERPDAFVTLLDNAPEMVRRALSKLPTAYGIAADMTNYDFVPTFDCIVSSMALHWLTDPYIMLKRMQGWLREGGRIFVALPVMGSFLEWKNLCAEEGIEDGLWPLPHPEFAASLATKSSIEPLIVDYLSAGDFLRQLKATGAFTPREGATPIKPQIMRKLLQQAPFCATFSVVYLEIVSSGSI